MARNWNKKSHLFIVCLKYLFTGLKWVNRIVGWVDSYDVVGGRTHFLLGENCNKGIVPQHPTKLSTTCSGSWIMFGGKLFPPKVENCVRIPVLAQIYKFISVAVVLSTRGSSSPPPYSVKSCTRGGNLGVESPNIRTLLLFTLQLKLSPKGRYYYFLHHG